LKRGALNLARARPGAGVRIRIDQLDFHATHHPHRQGEDPPRYEKACIGGDMSMSNILGVCYYKGECGLGKDDSQAVTLYKKACRGGDPGACHNLDLMKN
jgi:hypothetical protein